MPREQATSPTPEDLFQQLVDMEQGRQAVTVGRMFGSPVLKVGGKVYAMLVKGRLVVKLRRDRAGELVASDLAEPFDPGHGRPSKDWVAIGVGAAESWTALVHEAREVVGGPPIR